MDPDWFEHKQSHALESSQMEQIKLTSPGDKEVITCQVIMMILSCDIFCIGDNELGGSQIICDKENVVLREKKTDHVICQVASVIVNATWSECSIVLSAFPVPV